MGAGETEPKIRIVARRITWRDELIWFLKASPIFLYLIWIEFLGFGGDEWLHERGLENVIRWGTGVAGVLLFGWVVFEWKRADPVIRRWRSVWLAIQALALILLAVFDQIPRT